VLKKAELGMLKLDLLQQRTIERSGGMTPEEIEAWTEDLIARSYKRMQELGIQVPDPTPDPTIVLLGSRPHEKWYSAKRLVKGKSVRAKDAIIRYTVLTTVCLESDGLLWLHASLTRHDNKMPSYADLSWLKDHWFAGRTAIQVFPPEDQHVSDHNSCLHLWSCMEERFSLPDFRKLGTI
jgi:hypothetical protein